MSEAPATSPATIAGPSYTSEDAAGLPVDASEAAKDPNKRGYFFGHHDEDRLEFSRGRNLNLNPAQKWPPLNFFVYPYAELDGRPHHAIDRKFTFTDREK